MKIPFGYRFIFIWLSSHIMGFIYIAVLISSFDVGSTKLDLYKAATSIPSFCLTFIFVASIILYLLSKGSQVRLPNLLEPIEKYMNKMVGAGEDKAEETGCLAQILMYIIYMSLTLFIVIGLAKEVVYPLVKTLLGDYISNLFVFFKEQVFNKKSPLWQLPIKDIASILFWGTTVPFLIARIPPYISKIKERLQENKTFKQLFVEGRGGSARWAGIATYDKVSDEIFVLPSLEKDGLLKRNVILGKSLASDDPLTRTVSIRDDAHMLTIGMTGSGKSTTTLLPNLAMYEGSCVVLDPKGELANKTYRRRSAKHWLQKNNIRTNTKRHFPYPATCYVLDPFNETSDLPLNTYNPLSEIDINSDRVRELLSAISDGCVLPEGGDNVHFEENAKNFIEGVLAHVLSKYPKENHNLPFVYDLVHGIDRELKVADPTLFKELLYIMMKNDAAGGLPQTIASKLLDMGDRERGSVLSTVSRSLKWISDPAMRKHLQSSNFSFRDIPMKHKNSSKTVYIVLPDGLIKEQMRWLRTLISISITSMKSVQNPLIPTLFIMDEFPKLGGKIQTVSDGFGILRGYGIKLWAFIQDIGQLKKDYPERWSSITANSTVQVFGVNDIVTAEWVSENLGAAVHKRTDGREGLTKMYRKRIVNESIYPLLTPNEVMNKFGKTTNRQLVMPTDGLPMRLERLAYKPLNFSGKRFRSYPLRFHFEDW